MKAETQFNDVEYDFAYPDGIEHSYWNTARNKIILNRIKAHHINHILDVGCGRGIVTSYLYNNQINISGVELGKTTPISNTNVPILFNTDAVTIPLEQANQIISISLFDVIEHIEYPVRFINGLVSHFKNAEYLVITVPALQSLWSNFDVYYGHYKRYDLEGINAVMKEAGFDVIENRYFFNSLALLMKLSSMVFKNRMIQFNVPHGIIKMVHAILGYLFYLEMLILPGNLPGSSIICIAKKSKV